MIKIVFFDFGGVLAEEGFYEGLKVIGKKNGLDPNYFFQLANEAIHSSGYVTGTASEREYWSLVREQSGISEKDEELRHEILERFAIRKEMLRIVKELTGQGLKTAILSDQTDWLETLNDKEHFFHLFDRVFNSYRIKKSKRDSSLFVDIAEDMVIKPEEALFIDDNAGNVERAGKAGFKAIHFTDMERFKKSLTILPEFHSLEL